MLAHELNVLAVEIRSGLVESEQTALHAEHFGEHQADEQRREHLLARTAAGTHIYLLVALHHHLRTVQYFLIVQVMSLMSRARKIVTKFHNYSYEIVMSPVIVDS